MVPSLCIVPNEHLLSSKWSYIFVNHFIYRVVIHVFAIQKFPQIFFPLNCSTLIVMLPTVSVVTVEMPILKLLPFLRIPYCVSSNGVLERYGPKNGLGISP